MQAVLYTSTNCPNCTVAKRLLSEHNIPYSEMLIGRDITREEVVEQFPAIKQLPIVVIDGQLVGSVAKLRSRLELLDETGGQSGQTLFG